MLFFLIFSIIPFKWDEGWKDYMKKGLLRCNETLKIASDCEDPYILGMIYTTVGSWFCAYGFLFIEDETRQREHTENGLELFRDETMLGIPVLNEYWTVALPIYLVMLLLFFIIGWMGFATIFIKEPQVSEEEIRMVKALDEKYRKKDNK